MCIRCLQDDGLLSVNYSRPFLETASRHKGIPEWTPQQVTPVMFP